jgi:hypothetical protein
MSRCLTLRKPGETTTSVAAAAGPPLTASPCCCGGRYVFLWIVLSAAVILYNKWVLAYYGACGPP